MRLAAMRCLVMVVTAARLRGRRHLALWSRLACAGGLRAARSSDNWVGTVAARWGCDVAAAACDPNNEVGIAAGWRPMVLDAGGGPDNEVRAAEG
jgi:hypothetical protein